MTSNVSPDEELYYLHRWRIFTWTPQFILKGLTSVRYVKPKDKAIVYMCIDEIEKWCFRIDKVE